MLALPTKGFLANHVFFFFCFFLGGAILRLDVIQKYNLRVKVTFLSFLQELQKCFEEKDIPMLQDVLGRMPEEEARGYLKKCIDSGLWVPNAQDAQAQAKEGGDSTSQEESDEEYERVAEEVDK